MADFKNAYMMIPREPKEEHCVVCDQDFIVASWNFLDVGTLGHTTEGKEKQVCPLCSVKLTCGLEAYDVPAGELWGILEKVMQDIEPRTLYEDITLAYENSENTPGFERNVLYCTFNDEGLRALESLRQKFDYRYFLELCVQFFRSEDYLDYRMCIVEHEAHVKVKTLMAKIEKIASS